MLAEGVLLSGLSLSSTSTYPPLKQETFVEARKGEVFDAEASSFPCSDVQIKPMLTYADRNERWYLNLALFL